MSELAEKDCLPCKGDALPMKRREVDELHRQISEWNVVDEHHLVRRFDFGDFRSALAFTNAIGEIAEQQGHHPDILLGWGKAEVTIWTHAIDGLSESDFVLAAKIDRLPR